MLLDFKHQTGFHAFDERFVGDIKYRQMLRWLEPCRVGTIFDLVVGPNDAVGVVLGPRGHHVIKDLPYSMKRLGKDLECERLSFGPGLYRNHSRIIWAGFPETAFVFATCVRRFFDWDRADRRMVREPFGVTRVYRTDDGRWLPRDWVWQPKGGWWKRVDADQMPEPTVPADPLTMFGGVRRRISL